MERAGSTESTDDVMNVERQLGLLVRQLYVNARRSATDIDPSLAPFGLKLLRFLARSGPTHASAAAAWFEVDRSLISRQTRQLEELGLITVCVDENDGRARFLDISPLARERMTRVDSAASRLSREMFGSWSGDDLRRFAELLSRVTDQAVAAAAAVAVAEAPADLVASS